MSKNLSYAVSDYLTGNLRRHFINRVQTRNPITDRFVKLDTRNGRILTIKRSPGPYKNTDSFEDWLRKRGF